MPERTVRRLGHQREAPRELGDTKGGTVSGDELKALARRQIEEIFSEGNLDVIDEIVAADYVCYDHARPEPVRGREALKQAVTSMRTIFPDFTVTVDDQVAEGETVVTRWTATGTHKDEVFGIAATGKQVTMKGIDIERVVEGRITEVHTSWDALGVLQQLGGIPARVVI